MIYKVYNTGTDEMPFQVGGHPGFNCPLVKGDSYDDYYLEFEQFPYLILWSSTNNGPFIALEPWTGLSTCSDEGDVFEKKRNMQSVRPGKWKKYSFSIAVF